MHRLLFALSLVVPSGAWAQDYLSPEAFRTIIVDNALCYGPQPDGSCGWVEIYADYAGHDVNLHYAAILGSGDLMVLTQEVTWVGDALCIREGDFGIMGISLGTAPVLRFDLEELVSQSQVQLQWIIEAFAEVIPPKTCFRTAPDPARPGGYVQHIFHDGVRDDTQDTAIALVPLSQGTVRLTTPQ